MHPLTDHSGRFTAYLALFCLATVSAMAQQDVTINAGDGFALQVTTLTAEMAQKRRPFPLSVTVSVSSSAGTFSSPSSRRFCRIGPMASARLLRASSFAFPGPLAPGI